MFHSFIKPLTMGDIGEEQTEIEFVPLTTPVTAPVEPSPQPTPAPAPAEPVKEPVPAGR